MAAPGSQNFTLAHDIIIVDQSKSILTCKHMAGNVRWIKKLNDISYIASIIEDEAMYYAACESDEKSGRYLALDRDNGATLWDIPGKTFLNILYGGHLFLIFIDESDDYYLLKIDSATGKKIWHYRVGIDLKNYTITRDSIILEYVSGASETISTNFGVKM